MIMLVAGGALGEPGMMCGGRVECVFREQRKDNRIQFDPGVCPN